jgi:hypothetical protein
MDGLVSRRGNENQRRKRLKFALHMAVLCGPVKGRRAIRAL